MSNCVDAHDPSVGGDADTSPASLGRKTYAAIAGGCRRLTALRTHRPPGSSMK